MKQFFSNIKGDAFGGITAGVVALPLALAFGVSSGLGPSAGLYGAIFISFFAALFGGTNTQISGPTAPMTAVSMVVISGIVAANDGDLSIALPAILTVFLIAGLSQIGLGVLGLGKYIKYIPYPVVSGFMTAIGVIRAGGKGSVGETPPIKLPLTNSTLGGLLLRGCISNGSVGEIVLTEIGLDSASGRMMVLSLPFASGPPNQ